MVCPANVVVGGEARILRFVQDDSVVVAGGGPQVLRLRCASLRMTARTGGGNEEADPLGDDKRKGECKGRSRSLRCAAG